ncbi:MAG: glycosyltransferase family 2 protein [Thermoanaerobaculia bacterium]|nr:glycosyltransferase family 2 protein [Thermoanaerobaculia bacterium]
MSRTFSLSVLVVSWNGRAHLESLLPSLAAQQPVDGCTTETLVLDNGSNDGTVEWIADTHPRVRVIARRDNLGFAGGNNLLAAEARGDVLLLLNNDMRAEPDLVARYAALWRSVPGDVAGLAGALTDWEGERLDFGRGVMTFDGHAFGIDQGRPLESARLPEEGEEMLFGCGGNLWICRRSFLEAGGFDPAYFAYFEDVDLGWRLWAGGQRLLACPGARARHRQSATSARLGDSRRGALFERNALATAVKNYEAGLWERMAPVVLLTFASRLAAAGRLAAPMAAPTGRRARLAARLRRLADRLTGGAEGAVEWTHPQALAQLAGLGAFLGDVDAIAGERLRLAARRQRSDREIFRRFPLWIVPTYPGDEVLFGGEAFTTWLPEELEFRRASLSELLAIG